MIRWLAVLALVASIGCGSDGRSQVLGGAEISAEVLERGEELYIHYCATCHGIEGDGRGPSSPGLWPPPRDFRKATFKYAGTSGQGLPTDEALARIVRGGLAGTAMLPWDVPDGELYPILHYIKSFSPPGEGFRDPDRKVESPEIPPDPYADDHAVAVKLGEKLYHAGFQCSQCHPAYVTPDRYADWGAFPPRATNIYDAVPKWSPAYETVLVPTDFLSHPMRSVRRAPADADTFYNLGDLYRVIAYGLQGPMPGYGHLGADKIWAIVHYVESLARLRDTPEGRALRENLDALPQDIPLPPP